MSLPARTIFDRTAQPLGLCRSPCAVTPARPDQTKTPAQPALFSSPATQNREQIFAFSEAAAVF